MEHGVSSETSEREVGRDEKKHRAEVIEQRVDFRF
jgi:hypothetical protein